MGKRQFSKRAKSPSDMKAKQELSSVQMALNSARLELEEAEKSIKKAWSDENHAREQQELQEAKLRSIKEDVSGLLKSLEEIKKDKAELQKQVRDIRKELGGEEKLLASTRKELQQAKEDHNQRLSDDLSKHQQIKIKLLNKIDELKTENEEQELKRSDLMERASQWEIILENREKRIKEIEEEIKGLLDDRKVAYEKKLFIEEQLKDMGRNVQDRVVEYQGMTKLLHQKDLELKDVEKKHEDLKKEILVKKNALLAIVVREKKFHKTKDMLEKLIKDVGLDLKL